VLLPVQLDKTPLPKVFEHLQAIQLVNWTPGQTCEPMTRLLEAVGRALGHGSPYDHLEAVRDDKPIDERHLHLIDTCWHDPRIELQRRDGRRWYQIRLIVFGHHTALDRVERVEYTLSPAYPPDQRRVVQTDRRDCFQLKQLANGYSVVDADVYVRDQPVGLHLSRFVNMSDTGPHLDPLVNTVNAGSP
jgi:hypothetical protein